MAKIVTKQFLLAISIMLLLATSSVRAAKDTVSKTLPDTVKTGVYITSIHNIDFKQKEYTIDLWLWMKYKTKKFDFLQNMEIPQAKTVTKSFSTLDTSGGKFYLLMKLQCVMKDEWRIDNFPFDHQNLRFSLENSQFDAKSLVFIVDTFGEYFDKRFTLRKWRIDTDSIRVFTGTKIYKTGFGDSSVTTPRTVYSTFKIKLQITRNAMGLFWKMFLGMYLAFLIAFMCFFIHTDSIDSRYGLSVGALFAVVGNKYIVDSALPESSTFTLVDTLHGITLFFIIVVIISTSYTLKLVKKDKIALANKFDKICAWSTLIIYILLNSYFIYLASNGG